MKAQITKSGQSGPGGPVEVGTLIEHPKAYRLVQLGVAEPADDECREQANRHAAAAEVVAAKKREETIQKREAASQKFEQQLREGVE